MSSFIQVDKIHVTDLNAGERTQVNYGYKEYPIYQIQGDTLLNQRVVSPTDMSQKDFRISWDPVTGTMTYRPELVFPDIRYYGMEEGRLYAVDDRGNKLPLELGQKPEELRKKSENLKGVATTYSLQTNDGIYENLSLTRLFMLISLQRAEIMERVLLERSRSLINTTEMLELTVFCQNYLNQHAQSLNPNAYIPPSESYPGGTLWEVLTGNLQISPDSLPPKDATWDRYQVRAAFEQIMKAQDNFNSTSQKTLIDIESYCNRRDESYNMSTSATKQFMANNLSMARNL